MTKIEKVTDYMFDDILNLLNEFNNPNNNRTDWMNILNYSWKSDDDFPGYVIIEGNKIVGFLGTIFSTRIINNTENKFCNITSWIVSKKSKSNGLMLLKPLIGMKNTTITALSSSRKVIPVYKRLGFKELDTRTIILFPKLINLKKKSVVKVTSDKDTIETLVNQIDLRIFNDHLPYNCKHLLVYNDDDYCYIISTLRIRKHFHINQILYISNSKFFVKYFDFFKTDLKMNNTILTTIDERLLKNHEFNQGFMIKEPSPKLYISDLEPEQVDNLYSEFVLLKI